MITQTQIDAIAADVANLCVRTAKAFRASPTDGPDTVELDEAIARLTDTHAANDPDSRPAVEKLVVLMLQAGIRSIRAYADTVIARQGVAA